MACIRLTDLNLFIRELKKDFAHVDRRMVRMVERSDGWSATPGLRYRRLIVTARVGQDILRVESYCGVTCGIRAHDQRVRKTLARQRRSLQEACAALGIEVRSGTIEVGGLEQLTAL